MYFPQINIYDLLEYSTVQYSSLEQLPLFLIFFVIHILQFMLLNIGYLEFSAVHIKVIRKRFNLMTMGKGQHPQNP